MLRHPLPTQLHLNVGGGDDGVKGEGDGDGDSDILLGQLRRSLS